MSFYQYQPFSGVVRHLIIINVLMFIATYFVFSAQDPTAPLPPFDLRLAAYLPGSEYFQPYQIATHMFMHGGVMHIAFNMFSLYIFGPMVEMVWGHQRFLFYYLFCGVGAYLLYTAVQWWELQHVLGIDPTSWNIPMLGASGAIFGIFVAFAWNFPNQVISLLFPPISLKAKYFVPIMAILELVYGVYGNSTGVAHFAHLGGAVFGVILIVIWSRIRFK